MVETIFDSFAGTLGPFITTVPSIVNPIPAMSEWGMIAAALGLGLVGVIFAVRRKRAQTV